jgi:serine/threonine-protein kinase RsbW
VDKPVVDKPVKLTIASDTAFVHEIQDRVLAEVSRHGFSKQSYFAIKLALEEGLVNAMKHGNKLDKAKTVHIEYIVTAKKCEVMIEDQGPGFHRPGVPDPTLDENIEKCSGRGILLMEAYMDKVTWTHGGRRVRMVKKNKPNTKI